MTEPADLSFADREEFEELVGRDFDVALEDAEVRLRLLRVRDTTTPGATDGYTSFAVDFRGPVEVPLDQGTYLLSSDGVPESPIFIVPVAETDEGRVYEACFSRFS